MWISKNKQKNMWKIDEITIINLNTKKSNV